jgi:plasmid stabilization system protein ParE
MKVFWTEFALNSLRAIYIYYKSNFSNDIATKIKQNIFFATRQLAIQPYSGSPEPFLNTDRITYRFIISGNYKIIYKVDQSIVYITDVFDCRQNPDKILMRNNDSELINEPQSSYHPSGIIQ